MTWTFCPSNMGQDFSFYQIWGREIFFRNIIPAPPLYLMVAPLSATYIAMQCKWLGFAVILHVIMVTPTCCEQAVYATNQLTCTTHVICQCTTAVVLQCTPILNVPLTHVFVACYSGHINPPVVGHFNKYPPLKMVPLTISTDVYNMTKEILCAMLPACLAPTTAAYNCSPGARACTHNAQSASNASLPRLLLLETNHQIHQVRLLHILACLTNLSTWLCIWDLDTHPHL